MKKINQINSKIINECNLEIKSLVNYLKETLKDLNIESAIIFGSVINDLFFEKSKSDIDIVAYSSKFSLKTADNFIDTIEKCGGDFLDKKPIFLSDFISPRIEYFYKIKDITFDINIFPSYFYGFENIDTNVIHDSIDVVIGAMYENAILLFGKSPIENTIKQYAQPFYSQDTRKKRLSILKKRILKINNSIKKKINNNDIDILKELYKSRNYFIKFLFIKNKKYPIDLNNYIEYQLETKLNYSEDKINILLFRGRTINDIANQYINFVENEINEEDYYE